MKVSVKNLGILKEAQFDVGDMTIICGTNNTGKTYATYSLYGFLKYWNEVFVPGFLTIDTVQSLRKNGYVKIAVEDISKSIDRVIYSACSGFSDNLPAVFAAPRRYFADTVFEVSLNRSVNYQNKKTMPYTADLNKKTAIQIHRNNDEDFIELRINTEKREPDIENEYLLEKQANRSVLRYLYGDVFPVPFIISIERTGAAMFQRELDLSRNRLLELLGDVDKDINPFSFMETYNNKGYALPVREDVDFIRGLESIVKQDSIISQGNPDIIDVFNSILGGGYRISKEGLYYIPDKSNVRLTMSESASSVRSLLNMGIYLRHIAQPGDFLMIDEPELNLHPMNQRLIARVLARLVNAGIRVFITTHSDYILKELNSLIMLHNTSTTSGKVMEKYHYQANELLDPKKIKAYIAKKDLIRVDGKSRRQRHNTFLPAPIGEHGIEIEDFDDVINIMNDIQEEILFGDA